VRGVVGAASELYVIHPKSIATRDAVMMGPGVQMAPFLNLGGRRYGD
jgi:hypothetical protein